jgi:hypothetical protein
LEPGQARLESRIPAIPQQAAGVRTEPPKSPPQSNAAIPVATAAAPPPVLPPAVRVGSKGFSVAPTRLLSLSLERARSGMFDLPRSTAPAPAKTRWIEPESRGTRSRWRHDPPVVMIPAVSQVSLRTYGTPYSAALFLARSSRCGSSKTRKRARSSPFWVWMTRRHSSTR